MTWPVMKEAAGIHRNATAEAISTGLPLRSNGDFECSRSKDSVSICPICPQEHMRCWNPFTPHVKLNLLLSHRILSCLKSMCCCLKKINLCFLLGYIRTSLIISVVINPGATPFTRILLGAHSAAKLLVSWFIAPTYKQHNKGAER